jgi:hypothetical protein
MKKPQLYEDFSQFRIKTPYWNDSKEIMVLYKNGGQYNVLLIGLQSTAHYTEAKLTQFKLAAEEWDTPLRNAMRETDE